jgi:transcriptional regulator with XRE-family HTH domain
MYSLCTSSVKHQAVNKKTALTIFGIDTLAGMAMPKSKKEVTMNFGERLTTLRKAAGFTQQQLADEVGVSRRMIAYYEGQSAHPPTTLLPDLARALSLSTDELLGVAPLKKAAKPANSRLQRRLQQIEKLNAAEKRRILQVIDTLIESAQLKRKMQKAA